ncbi:MAG: hypothetical protein D6754_08180 [Alphaproteobacteria bacterium]|nr:MAG: hypothetical protein D6754_08180 [Alphaproteobacteria bacterium]
MDQTAELVGLSPRAKAIAEHLAASIAGADLARAPFDHFYLEDAFPADVYAEMLRGLPRPESYLPLNPRRWKRADGSSTRDRLYLAGEEMERIDADRRELWEDVAAALRTDLVRRAVYAKLKGDVALRLGVPEDEVVDQPGWPVLMLVRDTEDYEIKPHPDGQPRVVTMQFYLAEDDSQLDLGTSLYERSGVLGRLTGGGFREVKRFAFRPNSGYAFAVNDLPGKVSYHGRQRVPGELGVRNTLLIQWRSEPGEAGKDGLRGAAE